MIGLGAYEGNVFNLRNKTNGLYGFYLQEEMKIYILDNAKVIYDDKGDGRVNSDYIADIVKSRYPYVEPEKETTFPGWKGGAKIARAKPDVIIMHVSAFQETYDRLVAKDSELYDFVEVMVRESPQTKYIFYSRLNRLKNHNPPVDPIAGKVEIENTLININRSVLEGNIKLYNVESESFLDLSTRRGILNMLSGFIDDDQGV